MSTELEQTRDRLLRKLNFEVLKRLNPYDAYYEGEQALRFLAPALQAELGERLTELVINIARDGVSSFDERLDVLGFRYPGGSQEDDPLWNNWLHNDMDLLSQQVHQESLALGRAYMIVGAGDDPEFPLITAESAFDTIHEDDPRTHDIRNGIHRWTELDGTRWITLYTPDGRLTWWRPKKAGDWAIDSQEAYDVALPRLVPFLNQPRLLGRMRAGKADQRLGRSEFHDIIPIIDAINKMATDMMISGEFHAMPRRWAFGLKAEDFVDKDDNPINAWAMAAGKLWANEDKDIKVGQFAEADLKNFRDTVKLLIQIAGQLLALPGYYNSFETINPPSADSIRSSESRLVKRAERKQSFLGNRHGRVQRLVLLLKKGKDEVKAQEIETLWRSASTPTKAQEADAVTKLVTTKDGRGRSIVPVEQAREDLGYTPEQRKRMSDMDAGEDPQIAAAMKSLEAAGANASSGN